MNWEAAGASLAAVLWAIGIARLLVLRRGDGDRSQWRECATFILAALCLTLQLPTAAQFVNNILGVDHVARLLGNLAGIVAAWLFYPCLVRLLLSSSHSTGILGSTWLMLATIAALIGLFTSQPLSATSSQPVSYAPSPFTIYDQSLAYNLVYLAYLGAIVCRMLWLTIRDGEHIARARMTPSRLRHQLRAQALGWTAGVGFALHESTHAILRQRGLAYPFGDPALVSNGLLLFAVLGVTGGELGAPQRWLVQYRSYRRLFPLWRLLYTATPAIALAALFSPPRLGIADATRLNRIALRRLRRVIEIRDGILALRPFCDARVASDAAELCRQHGLGDAERQAVIEAAILLAASQHSNLPTIDDSITGREAEFFARPSRFEDEVRHLEGVATALLGSPIVAAAATRHRARANARLGAYLQP